MKNEKLLKTGIKLAQAVAIILFWLLVWDLGAMLVNNVYFLPGVADTLKALTGLIVVDGKLNFDFFLTVLFTILRVLCGLVIGIAVGIALAFISNRFEFINRLVSPIISVIKATPIASFIVLLWISMSGNTLTVFVAFLMVMPIIWHNVMDAYRAIPNELIEVCDIFELGYFKRVKILVLPTVLKFLAPAIITATGLAWKSEIAAEIIAYTAKSIGGKINDAKYFWDTPTVFAWTLVVIFFSIILERGAKYLLGRFNK